VAQPPEEKNGPRSLPVCGEEVDANELDLHGHFVVGNKPDHEWTNGI